MLLLPEPEEALNEGAALLEARKDFDVDRDTEIQVEAGIPPTALNHEAPLWFGLKAAEGLARDGHLRGGANAAVLCSMAWLFWRLATLPEVTRASLPPAPDFLMGDWVRCFDAAAANFGCSWGHYR